MWPAIITALENTIVVTKYKPGTKAKIQGFLKQLKSYPFLCTVATYLDILEKITPTSLVFEGDGLLPFEVKPTIDLTVSKLEDLIECSGSDEEELSDSHLSRFQFVTKTKVLILFLFRLPNLTTCYVNLKTVNIKLLILKTSHR